MHPDGSTQIQEVITYCASRLRAALVKISDDTRTERKWWHSCFVQELQFTLSYIGMAAAIGQSIDIPFVIRQLASDLHRHVPRADAGFIIDPDFLRSLDAGTDHDDPTRVVKSYHGQWWTARKSPPETDLINAENIADFLNHHRNVTVDDDAGINNSAIDNVIPLKPSYGWSRAINCQPVPPCDQCRLYRAITVGALDDLRDLRHFAHGMEVGFASRSRLAARRAANLYQLYHAASLKNGSSEPSKRKARSTPTPEEVRTQAQAELLRLSELPKTKWTPPCPFSSKDALDVLKPHPHTGKVHSGYVNYLPWGSYGESSGKPLSASPQEWDWYSVISPSTIDHDHDELSPMQRPVHFEFPPLRDIHGDPPRLDESAQVVEPCPPSPPKSFYVPNPPIQMSVSMNQPNRLHCVTDSLSRAAVSDQDSDSDYNSIGPNDALGDLNLPHQVDLPDFPVQSFPEPDSGSDIYEVTAMEAATALAHSDSDLDDGGLVLAALVSGQLAVETRPAGTCDSDSISSRDIGPADVLGGASHSDSDSDVDEVTAMEAAAALADSESEFGDGGMVLAAILGGQLAVETVPPPSSHRVITASLDCDSSSESSRDVGPAEALGDSIVPPQTSDGVMSAANWFGPLAAEFLYVSSDEE